MCPKRTSERAESGGRPASPPGLDSPPPTRKPAAARAARAPDTDPAPWPRPRPCATARYAEAAPARVPRGPTTPEVAGSALPGVRRGHGPRETGTPSGRTEGTRGPYCDHRLRKICGAGPGPAETPGPPKKLNPGATQRGRRALVRVSHGTRGGREPGPILHLRKGRSEERGDLRIATPRSRPLGWPE